MSFFRGPPGTSKTRLHFHPFPSLSGAALFGNTAAPYSTLQKG
jgi:hypothetical protein